MRRPKLPASGTRARALALAAIFASIIAVAGGGGAGIYSAFVPPSCGISGHPPCNPNGGGAVAPAVGTAAASSVTSTGATLNGNVNPESQATTYHFDWGLTASYGNTTSLASAGSGSASVGVSASIAGLSAGTTYHFRVEATNATGTSLGGDLTFATPAGASAPTVATGSASGISTTAATIAGTVNPNSQATTYHFDYGLTASYGSTTTTASAGSGSSPVAESAGLSGLTSGVTYHFRIEATNATGTSFGADATLATTSSGSRGTGPSTATCAGGTCGAIQAVSASLGVPDGAGSTFSRNFFVFFPAGLSGSVPVEVTFSDGQACSTNVATCVDGAEGFINIAAQKKFIVVDVRCTPTDHGVTIGSLGCNYFTPDAYPVQAAGTTFAYCGPNGGTAGSAGPPPIAANPQGANCNDSLWFDGLLNTYLPAHMSTFCTGGACTLDRSRVFLEGGSKGFSLTQQLMCSPITGPEVDGAFGGSTLQSSVFTSSVPPNAPSAAASCPYLLHQSGTYPSSTYTYTGTGITHPIMFGYWDGLGDHPEAQNGQVGANGFWTYSEDQLAAYLQGPNYGCPSTFSSSSTLTPVAAYSGGATITGHVYNCGGAVAGGTVWIATNGPTGSGSCHAGSCDGTLAANQTIADGFQFGPEMWQFWTTGTFF